MSDVEEIIDRMILAAGAKNAAEMTKSIGFSSGAVSQWKKRGSVPEGSIARAATHTNVRFEWIRSGEGAMCAITAVGDAYRRSPKPGDAIRGHGNINDREDGYLRLDETLMREVIEAVEEFLKAERKELAPEKKGLLIVELYKEFAEAEEKKVDKAKVIQFIRLAA